MTFELALPTSRILLWTCVPVLLAKLKLTISCLFGADGMLPTHIFEQQAQTGAFSGCAGTFLVSSDVHYTVQAKNAINATTASQQIQ